MYGINRNGVAVGRAATAAGVGTGFTFANGTLTPVAPPGAASSYCTGINTSGTIIGVAFDSNNNETSFVDVNGSFTTLAPPGAHSNVSVSREPRCVS